MITYSWLLSHLRTQNNRLNAWYSCMPQINMYIRLMMMTQCVMSAISDHITLLLSVFSYQNMHIGLSFEQSCQSSNT